MEPLKSQVTILCARDDYPVGTRYLSCFLIPQVFLFQLSIS